MASETQTNNKADSMMFCDVLIKGKAEVQITRGNFILGFGKCFYMKIDLEAGHKAWADESTFQFQNPDDICRFQKDQQDMATQIFQKKILN